MLRRVWELAGGAVATAVDGVNGVAELLGDARSGAASVSPGRVHVGVRGVQADADAARRVERLLGAPDAVRRAEVNQILGHVMIEFDPIRLSVDEVVERVREAERE